MGATKTVGGDRHPCWIDLVRSLIPERFRRRAFLIATSLTILLWAVALLLWCARDLVSGSTFPLPYKSLLAETFGLGVFFSAVLAAAIGVARRGRGSGEAGGSGC